MAGLAAHAIITKGLTCGKTTACSGSLITAGPFSLFCVKPYVPPVYAPNDVAGGGSYPLQPGQISQLYQPVPNMDQYLVVDRAHEADYLRRRIPVTITLKVGTYSTEKIYMVPENRANVISSVSNLINTTKERMSISLKNLRRIAGKAKVIVSNFRKDR